MKSILIPAAALVAASLSTFAAVSPGYATAGTTASIAVSQSDLDLSRVEDRRILDERIEDAARQVCRTVHGTSPLVRKVERECRAEAVARAGARFDTSAATD